MNVSQAAIHQKDCDDQSTQVSAQYHLQNLSQQFNLQNTHLRSLIADQMILHQVLSKKVNQLGQLNKQLSQTRLQRKNQVISRNGNLGEYRKGSINLEKETVTLLALCCQQQEIIARNQIHIKELQDYYRNSPLHPFDSLLAHKQNFQKLEQRILGERIDRKFQLLMEVFSQNSRKIKMLQQQLIGVEKGQSFVRNYVQELKAYKAQLKKPKSPSARVLQQLCDFKTRLTNQTVLLQEFRESLNEDNRLLKNEREILQELIKRQSQVECQMTKKKLKQLASMNELKRLQVEIQLQQAQKNRLQFLLDFQNQMNNS